MIKKESVIKDERYYKAYLENRTISRRGLFRGLLKSARQQPLPLSSVTAIRPPGAIAESAFTQTCTGCEACMHVCGEHLIVMVNQKPELDFSTQYCSRCLACTTACQSGALSPSAHPITAHPGVKNICQNTYIYCDTCADYCDKQALLWLPHQPPTLALALCDGCGECAFRCPAKALEMQLTSPKMAD